MSKYGARRVTVDGIRFDSGMEARRYQQLQLLQRAGMIDQLEVHPRYEILPAHKHPVTGKRVRGIHYEADFRYVDIETGAPVVEDVKGHQTPVFRLKRKLVEYQHKIRIVLIEHV